MSEVKQGRQAGGSASGSGLKNYDVQADVVPVQL